MKIKHLLILSLLIPCLALAKEDEGALFVQPALRDGGIIKTREVSPFTFELTAVANEGYHFQSWADGNTNATITYAHPQDENADTTFFAIFVKDKDVYRDGGNVTVEIDDPSIPSYQLTVHNGEGEFYKWNNGSVETTIPYREEEGNRFPFFIKSYGKVTYSYGVHPHGTIKAEVLNDLHCQVTAIPDPGYSFLQWIDGITDNPRFYDHVPDETADHTLWAVFTKDEDIIRANGHVEVSVLDADEQIYELAAIPDEKATFVSWVNSSKDVKQIYQEIDGALFPFFVVLNGSMTFDYDTHAGGHIEARAIDNLLCEAIAIPAEGYKFISWIDGNTNNPRQFTHVADENKDSTILAVFAKIEDVERPHGMVSVDIIDQTIPAFTLTAHPEKNAYLKIWSNASVEASQPYLESDGILVPFFINENGSITLIYESGPGGVVSAEQQDDMMTFSVLATPNDYYEFLFWSDGETANPRTYAHNPLNDKTLHAVFGKSLDIHLSGGHTEVAVTDESATEYILTAVEDASCATFYRWSNGSTSRDNNYKESDGQVIPYFTHGENAVIYDLDNHEGGSIKVEPTECGFVLTAHANPGYTFCNWEDGSRSQTREVEYLEGTYTAYFGGYIAKVDEIPYGTLEDAVTAAEGGKTIILLDNTTQDMVVPYPIKIDGVGYSIGNLTILCNASVDVISPLHVNGIYLQTQTGSSAQLYHADENLTYTNAYFDVILHESTNTNIIPRYGFSLPFAVNAATGVSNADDNKTLISGEDYLIWSYDGVLRSNTGNGWVKTLDGVLPSGRFYMLEIDAPQKTWRFRKEANAPLYGDVTLPLTAYTGSPIDGGWNAIGNGLLHYANASINGIPFIQVYDNIKQKYQVKMTNQTSFVVGCPFFAQVAGENTLVLSDATHSALFAPKKAEEEDSRHLCELRFGTEEDYDVAYITAAEDAQYQYEIGRDLLKMGISTTSPGIWLNDYGHILCVQDAALSFNEAYYALSLFAPNAGQFTLTALPNVDGDELYLTEGGSIVWNLTDSPCTLNMRKGTDNRYGLILLASDNTSTPTGTGNLNSDSSPRKEMRNQILYIIRNGVEYNVLGGQMDK